MRIVTSGILLELSGTAEEAAENSITIDKYEFHDHVLLHSEEQGDPYELLSLTGEPAEIGDTKGIPPLRVRNDKKLSFFAVSEIVPFRKMIFR